MSKKHKKLTKSKKKFFIIASCYVAIFLVTAIVTMSTLAWYGSSTWSTEELYMGGPVYIDFTNGDGTQITSGEEKMELHLPPYWDKLYPGMNIHFEATCTLQGAKFENTKSNGETLIVYTTGAILRAKVLVEVTDPKGNVYPGESANPEDLRIAKELYDNLWPQLQAKARNSSDGVGKWVFDYQNTEDIQENYFYYVLQNQTHAESGDYELVEIGGTEEDAVVGFLNDAVITLSGLSFVNEHADCKVDFKIVFHALQAFLPYENKDLNTNYQGDTTGRETFVTYADIGTPKPLTVANSRDPYARAFDVIYKEPTPTT